MTYVKIEDDIFRHPKMIEVSSGAKLLYIASICYSGSSLTDGYIPRNAPPIFGAEAGITNTAKAVRELVNAGLWHEVERGYQVHDYLDFNESAEKVHEKRRAARERMNRKRGANLEESSDDVRANNSRTDSEVQEPTTTTTTSLSNESEGGANASAKPKPKRGTKIPDDFTITEPLRAYAKQQGLSEREIDHEAEKFVNYWQGEGRPKKDWNATWRSWVLKAVEDRPGNVRPFRSGGQRDDGEFLGTDGLKAKREAARRAQGVSQ